MSSTAPTAPMTTRRKPPSNGKARRSDRPPPRRDRGGPINCLTRTGAIWFLWSQVHRVSVNVETRQVVDYSRQLHCFAAPSNGLHRVKQCQSACGRHGPPQEGLGRPDQRFRLRRSSSHRLHISLAAAQVLINSSVSALDREEVGPGLHLPVPLEQCPPLAFGHAAPDTELNLVVERFGEALDGDRTMPADHGRFPLRSSTNEEFVGIG